MMPSPRTKRYDNRKIIEQIQSLDAKGWTLGMIANELNQDEEPAPRGGPWKAASVRHILTQNPQTPPAAPQNAMCIHVRPCIIRRGDVAAKVWQRPLGDYSHLEEKYDEATGKHKRWDEHRLSDEDLHRIEERLCLQARALEHLTWSERAARITFPEPLRYGFGEVQDHTISSIVEELTKASGHDVNALLDRIEGQPAVKGSLRFALKRLLRELAIQRQENVHVRQQLVALKTARHTELPDK